MAGDKVSRPPGEVAEWLNPQVSKTGLPARVAGVRISPSPLPEPPAIPNCWIRGRFHFRGGPGSTRLWRFCGVLQREDSLRDHVSTVSLVPRRPGERLPPRQ